VGEDGCVKGCRMDEWIDEEENDKVGREVAGQRGMQWNKGRSHCLRGRRRW